jgi:hypothetical protein
MLKIHHHSHLGLCSKSYGLTFSCKIKKKKACEPRLLYSQAGHNDLGLYEQLKN